jgi:hypothetical protein
MIVEIRSTTLIKGEDTESSRKVAFRSIVEVEKRGKENNNEELV